MKVILTLVFLKTCLIEANDSKLLTNLWKDKASDLPYKIRLMKPLILWRLFMKRKRGVPDERPLIAQVLLVD